MLTHNESMHFLTELCVAGATLGILYNIVVAAILVARFGKTEPLNAPTPQPVTILKPLYGAEPGLFARLASLCTQAYPESIQLVCGIQKKDDHAVHAVRLLQRLNRDTQIELVIDEHSRGPNRKIANLVNMEGNIRHDIIILSDSDILVDDDFVGRLVAELQRPGTGAVTCVYYGVAAGGMWARLSALNINSQFLPNVVAALTFGAAKPCFGSAIAIRAETLKRIGGLACFLDDLADDHAIGNAVRALGLDVAVSHQAVGHVCFEPSFRAFWEHHMRVSRTVKSIDPVGYIGTIFMHPLTLSMIAACTGATHPFLLPGIAFASRAILSASSEHAFELQPQSLWLLALHDTISFAVFVCSFFGSAVEWRGLNYRILQDGTIERNN
jgi:ceramide glucosyltransferase